MKAVLGKYGIGRSTMFAVNITPPNVINSSFINDLPLLIDTVNIPSIGILTDKVKIKGYGMEQNYAVGSVHEDVTITIIADGQGKVLEFLDKWVNLTFNTDSTTSSNKFGIPSGMANYPVEYWGTVEIYLYDITSAKYRTVTLHNCFPVTRGEITLGWESTDMLMKIPVSFSYQTMTTDIIDSLANTSTDINLQTGSNNRNIEKLQSIIPNTNIEQYTQRLQNI